METLLLVVAGLFAGVLNAVAGGGTFLAFPALVYAGVPPVSANATATLAAMPGYIGSAWAYRHDLRAEGRLGLRAICVVSAIGAFAGAGLLLVTSDAVFTGVVPWLLLAATLIFAAGPSVLAFTRKQGLAEAGPLLSAMVLLAVATYGGYFNGGLGIMLLAAFGLIGYTDLHNMNGLKNGLSALLSLIASATFIAAGLIAWQAAVPMAISTAIGGFIGAHYSRKVKNTKYLRMFIVAVGVVMSGLFFLR
ncbi:sulfite exporter TauE/SafE family protein (plasmid) [Pseudorhodobacter turbinis]|uniref:Probable membrane transporter protein n=1 Tax=Pseudorhodobacter turbinis TaxID=2500533 RepID=A0A4P8EIS6_9RHOB|nr:sulfite exporter TauE/SafE family protein [Pseudorhodobacter turbinis]QCO56886.1 sulfite exporter TauE/SafE family protein [Pseudorhodobacter turbinis]